MKKILVIINKNWETEPVLNALTNPKLRPAAKQNPKEKQNTSAGHKHSRTPRPLNTQNRKGEET